MENTETEDYQGIRELSENKETFQHLWKIGHELSTTCPAASRYYMFNLKRYLINDSSLKLKGGKSHSFCHHCGSLWSPENLKVKIQPVPSKNNHIKKLLKWEAHQPWKLNSKQKRKLKKFKEATSKIVYSCLICKKTTKYPCFKRKMQSDIKRNSLYTLPSTNIKGKKIDLNAGLFIASSKQSNSSEMVEEPKEEFCDVSETQQVKNCNNNTELKNSKDTSTSTSKCTLNLPVSSRYLNNSKSIKHSASNILVTEKISSNKKKKKSLLAQILKQEEDAKKRKSSLSSFLVSL